MASFYTFLTFFLVLVTSDVSIALTYQQITKISTISAAPALLPEAPLSNSPSLSPDISPLFPTPGVAPSDSSLPTIPASPSPPNPDAAASSPDPDAMAFPPASTLPASTAESLNKITPLDSVVMLVTLSFFLFQLLVCEIKVT